MDLREWFLTHNNCYKTGRRFTPTGIMLHSTGANNPKLSRYVGPDDGRLGPVSSANWNQSKPDGREVCVHAFIGKLADGSVATYQTLPWDMRGWHAGGKANDTHIGFEICEDGLDDADYFAKVYREAVELCAMLCKDYNIKPESPSLICHSEGYKLGIASNHADVMHWFPRYGKNMDTFRADVAAELAGNSLPVLGGGSDVKPTSFNLVIGGEAVFVPAEFVANTWWITAPTATPSDASVLVRVKVRDVLDTLGFTVAWDGDTCTITAVGKK